MTRPASAQKRFPTKQFTPEQMDWFRDATGILQHDLDNPATRIKPYIITTIDQMPATVLSKTQKEELAERTRTIFGRYNGLVHSHSVFLPTSLPSFSRAFNAHALDVKKRVTKIRNELARHIKNSGLSKEQQKTLLEMVHEFIEPEVMDEAIARMKVADFNPNRKQFSLSSLLQQIKKDGLATHIELPENEVQMVGIRSEIDTAIRNVLSNAQRFHRTHDITGKKLEPERRVKVIYPPDGHSIHIAISDNGQGIEPEIASKLFKERVSTRPGGGQGTQYVAKTIQGTHNGKIIVKSNLGEGTHIRFELRKARAV